MSLESAPLGLDARFPALDTMRAVGAFAVLTTHVGFQSGSYTENGVWGGLVSRLDVGVAIFFVLSGFLLSRPYLARAGTGTPAPGIGRYLWKRLLRIYPVYALAVVLAMVVVERNDTVSTRDWVLTFLLANTYVDSQLPYGLTQMWSLAAEVAFYLLLPLLMLLATGRGRLLRPRRVVAVLVTLCLVTVWWHLDGAAYWGPRSDGSALQWMPAYLTWFAVGIALALAHVLSTRPASPRIVQALVRMGRQPGSCWAVAAALMLLATTPLVGPKLLLPPTSSESLTKNLVYALIGGFLILPGVFAASGGGFGRVLGDARLRHLGLISYSVFSVHVTLLEVLTQVTGWEVFSGHFVSTWLLLALGSIVVAELIYRLVERPIARFRGLGRRRTPAPARARTPTSGTSIR